MSSFEIIAAVATSLGVITTAVIFTILYRSYMRFSLRELAAGKRDIELVDDYIRSSRRWVKIGRRVWAIFKGVLFYAFLALLIPVFVLSLLNKIQGNVSMPGDHALMVVASGSMSEKHEENAYLVENGLDDQFDTYSIILLEKVEAEDLKVWDTVAYVDNTGKNVIHRIIEVHSDGTYTTRGDANNQSDSFKPSMKNIVGRYTGKCIPYAGSFVMFFQSIGGIVTLLTLMYCLLMLDRCNAKIKDAELDRLEYLLDTISIQADPNVEAGECRAEFQETLYYKGYAYYFNEKGFIGKDEIHDESYLEKSNSAAIRVVDADGTRTETEVEIKFEEGDE